MSINKKMKVAEKIDWFEYNVFYTKRPGVEHDSKLLTGDQVHKGCFGDRLIAAFLKDDDFDAVESEKLIQRFFQWVLPREYHEYFDISKWHICDKTIVPYRFRIEVGDPEDRVFNVLVPFHEASSIDIENNHYMRENLIRGCLECYNPFVGYKILISGHNMPFERKDEIVYPVRIDSFAFLEELMHFHTLWSIKRLDVALDISVHFAEIANLFQNQPYVFKTPFFKRNTFLTFNPLTGAGALNCGKRGSQSDSFLRIYNKAAEQGDCIDFYPWDDVDLALEEVQTPYPKRTYWERPWTRFEFELRGMNAVQFFSSYWNSLADDVTPGVFFLNNLGIYQVETEPEFNLASNGLWSRLKFSSLWSDVVDSYHLYAKGYDQNFV